MTTPALSILLVEDNPGDAELLCKALQDVDALPFTLAYAEDLDEAFERLRDQRFELVLLDLSLPDSQGLDTFLNLHKHAPELPVIVLSGLNDEAMAVRTVHEGAQDYLVKGEYDGRLLVRAIRYALERHRLQQERARLLKSEREKSEQLLLSIREAHHRIKNNLQAISDLLYLELASQSGGAAQEVLRESIERVQAIALVHDLLSQYEDVQTVDTRQIIERLVPMVLKSCGFTLPGSLDLTLDVVSVRVSAKKGTNLSLIVNELVSNAVKHAFKAPAPNSLAVTLHADSADIVLRVRDNGPGLPEGFDRGLDAHVGLEVVQVLAERDLGGQLLLTSDGGLCAEVRFPW